MRSDETKTVSEQANEKQTCTEIWKEKYHILSDLLHQMHSSMHTMVTIMQYTTSYNEAYRKVYELSREFDEFFGKLKSAIQVVSETENSADFSDDHLNAKRYDALDKMLQWEGILGYTYQVWNICCKEPLHEVEEEIRYYEGKAE